MPSGPTATRCFAASGWTRMSRYGRYCVRRSSSAASCSTFSLRTNRVDLGERLADIASAELTGGDIAIMLGKPETPADTVAADTTSLPWKLLAGRLKLTDIRFSMSGSSPDSMRLGVALQSGRIAQAAVDLGTQQVAVGTVYLRQGDYVFLTDTTRVSPATGDTVTPETSDTLPWIIRVDHVQITDNSLKYGSLYGAPKAGLDFGHLAVSRLNLAADSIYNRGSAVRIDVDRLSLEERSGLTVRSMKGRFGMDSARLFLTDFRLRTASSSVRADASADASVLDRSPQARLRLSLKADVDLPEIAHLFPVGDTLRNLAAGKTLRAGADFSGTLGRLRIAPAEVAVPGIASLSLDGTLVKNKKVLWIPDVNRPLPRNRVLEQDEPDYLQYPNLSRVGRSVNSFLLYEAQRLFIDDNEVKYSPEQLLGGEIMAGDIKYVNQPDANGNYDNTINSNDRIYAGYPEVPEIVYGFGFSAQWKGLDFSVFFQGTANTSLVMSGFHPFGINNNVKRNVMQFVADDYWSESNPNIYAAYPRLSVVEYGNNTVASTYWLRDASFLKLKNAEIGYTYKKMRFYISGSNLLTFSKFKLWDPEQGGGSGLKYPTQRVFNIGIQMTL